MSGDGVKVERGGRVVSRESENERDGDRSE